MVELGNHQGRPPGNQCQTLSDLNSELSSASLSSSLLDHWINQDIASLEFLDGLCNPSNSRTDGPVMEERAQALNVTFTGSIKDSIPASLKVPEAEKLCSNDSQPLLGFQRTLSLPQWGFPMDVDFLKLDEVFQVEQSDLVQSPTLAELNANKEPFFDLEFGDIQFDSSSFSYEIKKEPQTTVAPQINVNSAVVTEKVEKIPAFTGDAVREKVFDCTTVLREFKREKPPEQVRDFKEMKKEKKPVVSSVPLAVPGVSSRTRQRTYSNTTEISVASSVSSNDEGFGSQAEDTDAELQLGSDNESLAYEEDSGDERTPSACSGPSYRGLKQGGRKKRYFWQYNIQSKGPKGPRMTMNSARLSDPHVLNDVTDPVFSSECHLEGVKHAGKARRGDGNDLTPNPRKLHNIGLELRSLNKMINDLSPACHSPSNMKPKSRKEKNKLASRCCRLKKKAQHEANKLKLFGLQQEHMQLMALMGEIKGFLREKKPSEIASRSCQQNLQKLLDCRTSEAAHGPWPDARILMVMWPIKFNETADVKLPSFSRLKKNIRVWEYFYRDLVTIGRIVYANSGARKKSLR